MTKEFISLKEAAELLGCSSSTVYKLTSNRKIPFYKPKGKIFFNKNDIIEYIDKSKVECIDEQEEKET